MKEMGNQRLSDWPMVIDDHGTVRWKANPVVRYLLDVATSKGATDLNDIHIRFHDHPEAQAQLYQLIGYSIGGWCEIDTDRLSVEIDRADARADLMRTGSQPADETAEPTAQPNGNCSECGDPIMTIQPGMCGSCSNHDHMAELAVSYRKKFDAATAELKQVRAALQDATEERDAAFERKTGGLGLRLYVWEPALWDYTSGGIFALAPSLHEAIKQVIEVGLVHIDQEGFDANGTFSRGSWETPVPVRVFSSPVAFIIEGGG